LEPDGVRWMMQVWWQLNHTLEEIGNRIGVTRERVRQIVRKALRRLRHSRNHRTELPGLAGVMSDSFDFQPGWSKEVGEMVVRKVVRILRDLVQDDGMTLGERHGPRALAVAQSMRSFLVVRLQDKSPYASLWDQFEAEPQTATAELVGSLEVLVKADPALAKRLNAFIEEYHQTIVPPNGVLLASLNEIEKRTLLVR